MNSVYVCSDTLTDCSGPNSPKVTLITLYQRKEEKVRERERAKQNSDNILSSIPAASEQPRRKRAAKREKKQPKIAVTNGLHRQRV